LVANDKFINHKLVSDKGPFTIFLFISTAIYQDVIHANLLE